MVCKFVRGKIQYFPSYLIIERSEAFNPVTLLREPGTSFAMSLLCLPYSFLPGFGLSGIVGVQYML